MPKTKPKVVPQTRLEIVKQWANKEETKNKANEIGLVLMGGAFIFFILVFLGFQMYKAGGINNSAYYTLTEHDKAKENFIAGIQYGRKAQLELDRQEFQAYVENATENKVVPNTVVTPEE